MRSFTAEEVPGCLAAWNQACPPRFELDQEVLESQTLGSSLFEGRASAASNEGFVACKWSPHGRLFAGPQPQRLHITLATHPSLLPWAVERARELGASSLSWGMDHDHIFPGLPLVEGWQLGAGLAEEMARLGFVPQEQTSVDVERDLEGFDPPAEKLEPLALEGVICRTAQPGDEAALSVFLAETFPGRWEHDVLRKLRGGEGAQIDLLVRMDEVLGFSATQNPSTARPLGGGVWRPSLGENWASLGPIGVSAKVRGKKLGAALLGASLQRLAREGARQTIIDWTSLVGFYGQYQFQPVRRYQHWTLDLSPSPSGA